MRAAAVLAAGVLLIILSAITVHGRWGDGKCEPNPCQNGGTCFERVRGFKCTCPDGFKGRRCQRAIGIDCYNGNGESYRGRARKTEGGKRCLRWTSGFMRKRPESPLVLYADFDGLDRNWCRNPNGELKPWCFYQEDRELKWDYCDVNECSPSNPTTTKPTPANSTPTNPSPTEPTPTNSTPTKPTPTEPTPTNPTPANSTPTNPTPTNSTPTNPTPANSTPNKPTPTEPTPTNPTPANSAPADPAPTEPTPTNPTPATPFSQCGKLKPGLKSDSKIVGDSLSEEGSHPWQVSLQTRRRFSGGSFSHTCGGILLSSCWVLTAAHCFDSNNEYQVEMGGLVIAGSRKDMEQTIPVKDFIVHENYRDDTFQNDIALLKLKSRTDGLSCAKETDFVKAACLPENAFPAGKKCVISGWGTTRTEKFSYDLREAQVFLISKDTCTAPSVYGSEIKDGMLCAGLLEGGIDSCQRDSGGPLICSENDIHYVTGVVSWGYGCAERNKPGVYTDVHKFLDWIKRKIN